MANVYSPTVLQAARAWIKENNNKKFELRPVMTDIMSAFLKDRQFTIPNLADIKAATTQTTTAMYFTKKDFTINTTKTNTPTGEKSGTATVDLTWAKAGFAIDLPSKQYDGNEVARAKGFAMSLYNAERTFWSSFDETLLSYLVSNKTSTTAASGGGTATGGDFEIDNANVDEFYNIVDAHMNQNDFAPEYMDIHDTYWKKYARHYAAQGAANSTNLSYQFDGFTTFASNKIINASGDLTTHYIIPNGGIAIIDWNEPANRRGDNGANAYLGTYQSLFYPEITFDLFVTEKWGDTSSDGGTVQDYTQTFEMTLNYSTNKQPQTTGTPIFKYTVAAS